MEEAQRITVTSTDTSTAVAKIIMINIQDSMYINIYAYSNS
jgi:hypothetical protein